MCRSAKKNLSNPSNAFLKLISLNLWTVQTPPPVFDSYFSLMVGDSVSHFNFLFRIIYWCQNQNAYLPLPLRIILGTRNFSHFFLLQVLKFQIGQVIKNLWILMRKRRHHIRKVWQKNPLKPMTLCFDSIENHKRIRTNLFMATFHVHFLNAQFSLNKANPDKNIAVDWVTREYNEMVWD